jgi:acetylglutamate kinase
VVTTLKKPVVLKIGGRALESEGEAAGAAAVPAPAVAALAADLAAIGVPVVIVHGGGAEVTAWCERMAIAPRFIDGLRVTDAPTLEVAAAVLAGLANKRLVARLRAAGLDAVGLSALDGGTVEAVPHPLAAGLGAVGAVRAVYPALLESLLGQGRIPVIASICDFDGALLNLNADDLAAALAGALHARALVLLSDAPGLVIEGTIVSRLDTLSLAGALDHPDVQGGMRPKLNAARAALDAGVPRVHIAAWSGPGTLHALLAGAGGGTTITAEADGPASARAIAAFRTSAATPAAAGGHATRTPTPTTGVSHD